MSIISKYFFLTSFIINLFFISTAKSQEDAEVIWDQFRQFTVENIDDANKSKAIIDQVNLLSKNIQTIRDYPDYYLTKNLDSIINATEKLKVLFEAEPEEIRKQFFDNLIFLIQINTKNEVVLSQTPNSDINSYLNYFNIDIRNAQLNSSKSEITIQTNTLRFDTTVFSQKSKHLLSLNVKSNINDVVITTDDNDQQLIQGSGAVLLKADDNSSVVIRTQIYKSDLDSGLFADNSDVDNVFIGQLDGSKLDPKLEYRIDKLVVFFQTNNEFVYKVKNIGDNNPLWRLKTIDSSLLDFITDGDYAVPFGKFKEALSRDNIISFDEAKSFMHRGGEHSIGIIFWEDRDLFAFYRCHNDNYNQVLVDAENCWIIKAPRESLPSGFKNTPYFNLGIYKSMPLENSPMTNFDYIMNLISKKLNNGQQLFYKYSGKILQNGERELVAIRDHGNHFNFLSNYYEKYKSMFVDTIKGAYYFAYGTGVLATLSALRNKVLNKKLGLTDKRLVKAKIFGKVKGLSARRLYMEALTFGASLTVAYGGLWALTKTMQEYDRYMHGNEVSLDEFLALSDEIKRNRDKTEFLIEMNRNYINILHSAFIDALVDYNRLEQKRALSLSREMCEKTLRTSCTDEMARGLYPEGT